MTALVLLAVAAAGFYGLRAIPHRRPLLTARRRRVLKRRTAWVLAGLAAGAGVWAWQTHPLGLALTLTAATATVALTLYARRARQLERHQTRLTAPEKPTVVYQHRFRRDLIQPYLDRGYNLDWFGYTGITNDYERRCGQHAEDSWWYILIDPNLSTFETNPDTGAVTWPNSYAAGLVETALIGQRCGLGNTRDNPAYRRQAAVRASLQTYALQLHQQVLTYGRTG